LAQTAVSNVLNSPARCYPARTLEAKALTPILNISGIAPTFAWFEWACFGPAGSGKQTSIFLCQGAQSGRGQGTHTTTFQLEQADKGVWMSVWVDDVDEMHKHCVAAGLEINFSPTNTPWHVREMHLRHPDGHVFRVSPGLDSEQ